MASQRLVVWNWGDWKPGKKDGVTVLDLDYGALVEKYQPLADAIGRGRIVSHHAMQHAHGVLFTFVVDG